MSISVSKLTYPTRTITQYRQPVGGGTITVNQTDTRGPNRKRENVYGENTPHYHLRVKRGELLPFTNWTKFEGQWTGTASYKTISGGYKYWWDPDYYFIGSLWEPTYTYIDSWVGGLALDYANYTQCAAAKIYSSGWDALTFAAELKSTISMFLTIGQSLLNLLKGDLAGSWLQYRYGWRTLYYDLLDITKAIQSIDDGRKRYREACGGSFTDDRTIALPWNWTSSYGTVTVEAALSLSARSVVVADIEPPKVSFNPAITAWELVKYSFIIDWFVNVGQWLASMSFLIFSSGYEAGNGYKATLTSTASVTSVTPKSGWTITTCSTNQVTQAAMKKRWPTSVPYSLTTSTRLDVSRVIDLIALVFQRLTQSRR